MCKPKNVEQYLKWSAETIDSRLEDTRIESLYVTNSNNIFNSVCQHPFFVGFTHKSKAWQDLYLQNTKTELFMGSCEPKLVIKPFTSVIEKIFRQNVLWNKGFPDPPSDGWYDHQNIYTRFNDLVRGSLVCRFIDGPAFVSDSLVSYAKEHHLDSRLYTQERDDGYYAFHVYIKFPVTVFDLEWKKIETTTEVEIQVTTQLQEVLRSLTHKFYESQRLEIKPDKGKWKWDFSSSRFKVGYLSHTLHLLESVIVESRDAVMNKDAAKEGDGNA